MLHELLELWECGSIRPDRSDKTLKFEIRKIDDLVHKVVPHFRSHPLRSSKQSDFVRFSRICDAVFAGSHRTREGFEEIVRIAMEMNPSGRRKYSESDILKSL
jgi:hypothetical protein